MHVTLMVAAHIRCVAHKGSTVVCTSFYGSRCMAIYHSSGQAANGKPKHACMGTEA